MATTLAVGQHVRVTAETTIGVQTCLMDMFYRVSAIAGTSCTDQQFADYISPILGVPIKNLLPTAANFWGVRVQITAPTLAPGVFSVSGSGAGSYGAGVVPTQVGAVITKYSALAGRKGRGRIYFGPHATGQLTGTGGISAGTLTLLGTLAATFVGTMTPGSGGNTATLFAEIYHRATQTGSDITTFLPSGKFGTQRRRGDYGRPNTP
jgi:hypothetical protein